MLSSKPFILIVSGPSGSGKSTIVNEFLKQNPMFRLSVSHTTRKKREGETEGKNYYYVSKEEFKRMIDNNNFVEWAKIYDNFYGTSMQEVDRILKSGHNVLLEINVDGLISTKNIFDDLVSVFIMPESMEELIRRLKDRNTESKEDLKKRILEVKREISYLNLYDYVIINKKDDLARSVEALCHIAQAEKIKTKRYLNIEKVFFGGFEWQE